MVCCYARQDKHWVTGPDGQRWENYVVLADAGTELEGQTIGDVVGIEGDPDAADFGVVTAGGCCGTSSAGPDVHPRSDTTR